MKTEKKKLTAAQSKIVDILRPPEKNVFRSMTVYEVANALYGDEKWYGDPKGNAWRISATKRAIRARPDIFDFFIMSNNGRSRDYACCSLRRSNEKMVKS